MATRRFVDEPAFVLHRYDWSESSLVLEVFTRNHGRIALVAKGVKRPTSQFRPVLLPLQPLSLGWGGDAEVRTLKSAQWLGGHVMPTGDALLSGSYLNELLLKLLARDDAHPSLFDHYAMAVQLLAERADAQELVLRAFELLLLKETGVLPDLSREGSAMTPIDPTGLYSLLPESGLRLAGEEDTRPLTGDQCLALHRALQSDKAFLATLKACADCLLALRTPLRHLLQYHSGVSVFRTRQLMIDVYTLTRAAPPAPMVSATPSVPFSLPVPQVST